VPVIEGRHLSPFRVDVSAARLCADAATARARLGDRGGVDRYRLAYRDVAGATNRTTLIAAIVPSQTVTVHTVFCLQSRLALEAQRVLCALLNSYVANYLVRRRVTMHVTAGIISRLPMDVWMHYFTLLDRPAQKGSRMMADFAEVDAQAFETLGVRVLNGRGIESRDVAAAPWVAVINKAFADRHFPGKNPIGQAIRVSIGWGGQPGTMEEPQPRQIVGVVADVGYPGYFAQTPDVIYVPFRQHLREYGSEDQWLHTRKVLLVRTAGDPLSLVRSVGQAVADVDKDQTAHNFLTMEDQVARWQSVTSARFLTSLFAVFGTLAVLLAMIGVYGVMSWIVGQRATEMGIRMALGAQPGQVVRMLLAQSLRPVGLGVVLGVVGGLALRKVPHSLLREMTTPDPPVLAGIAALMLAAAMAAAWVPMRRVLTLDPNRVLRGE